MPQTRYSAPIAPQLHQVSGTAAEELSWLSAWQIRERISDKLVSPVAVVEHFLARIEALDPVYHAFRMIDAAGARAQARRAEQAVRDGAPLGPLHGVPIAIKEHVAVKGMAWWDSATATHQIALRDSIEAERLRAAGAVIVGTTIAGLTTREFGESDQQPQNPWDRTRICGDSSSGSACALATGMVPLAIAADGLGSTRLPAAFCGLVGINPTRGRVASVSWSELNPKLLSAVSPLTRDARDSAIVLSVLAGPDGRDLFCLPDAPPDYAARLGDDIRGMKLGWTDDFGFAAAYAGAESETVVAAIRRIAFTLENAGAQLEAFDLNMADLGWACSVVMVADRTNLIRTEPSQDDVMRARDVRHDIWTALGTVLNDHDFLLSATTQHVAPTRSEWAQSWADPGYMKAYSAHTAVSNLLGWPAISVPVGFVDGMPVGLQILGRPDSEPRMLLLAQTIMALANSFAD